MDANKIFYLFLIVLLRFAFILGKKKSVDNYFEVCHRSDPDLNNCIQKTISEAMPQFIKGIPDLKLPSIDPMYISMLHMKEGDGNFKSEFSMINVTMTGLRRVKIKNFRINAKNESDVTIKFTGVTPWISYKSKYKLGGRILVIPVEGNGDLFFNFTNSVAHATVKGHVVKNPNDQKNYLSVDTFSWDLNVSGLKSHFTNLFNGDKRLGATMNKFFNDNAMELFKTFKHLPEQALGYVFKDYSSIVFQNYPFEELLPI